MKKSKNSKPKKRSIEEFKKELIKAHPKFDFSKAKWKLNF